MISTLNTLIKISFNNYLQLLVITNNYLHVTNEWIFLIFHLFDFQDPLSLSQSRIFRTVLIFVSISVSLSTSILIFFFILSLLPFLKINIPQESIEPNFLLVFKKVFFQKFLLGSNTHLKRVINMFALLIVVMFSWMYTQSKVYQIIHIK